MRKHNTPMGPSARRDAMDVSDFVYAATGARVRRLTLPNGEHWFPAADVCRELGYTTTRKALLDHVPEERRESLETVTGSHSLSIPAGREWRRDLQLVDLEGLILLVNGCTKPACLPFKQWVSKVIATVQREGSYALEVSEVSRPAPPSELMDAIVRLEMRTERFHTEVLDSLHRSEQAWSRILDALGCRPGAEPQADKRELRLRTEDLFAQWKSRLSITEDVWAVAVYILPTLAEAGRVGHSLDTLAHRTGLSPQRVHACLRFLQNHRCIRQQGVTGNGHPVYVAELPPA
ncbi:BRO-N domain-containing protein [Streptomyces hygroscopicus]|uniref:BRO-N domain-containing protein n=1 Tax=Streptomyces hygroscopicus TaxID=1912 RepID=UPI0007675CAF|nr:Bro-N domain-containing protein [Streptomyces hygroscopicus]